MAAARQIIQEGEEVGFIPGKLRRQGGDCGTYGITGDERNSLLGWDWGLGSLLAGDLNLIFVQLDHWYIVLSFWVALSQHLREALLEFGDIIILRRPVRVAQRVELQEPIVPDLNLEQDHTLQAHQRCRA